MTDKTVVQAESKTETLSPNKATEKQAKRLTKKEKLILKMEEIKAELKVAQKEEKTKLAKSYDTAKKIYADFVLDTLNKEQLNQAKRKITEALQAKKLTAAKAQKVIALIDYKLENL